MFAERKLHRHSAQMTSPLAAFTRPFLRPDVPVIWLDDDLVRLGCATDGPRVRCTRSQVAWLSSLDGTGVAGDHSEVGDGTDPSPLLAAAIAAGVIDDAARMPNGWRWLTPQRRWELEPALLAACHTYGNDAGRAAMDRRLAAVIHVPGSHAIAEAVRAMANTAGLDTSSDNPSSCTVLAGGVAPGQAHGSLVHALDGAHLPIEVFGATATVGPLVVPGSTACLRCEDLRRTDRDPRWPSERAQLLAHEASLRVRPEDPLLIHAAAALAVAVLRSWIDDIDDSWRDRSFSISLPLLEVASHVCTRHPLCGCWWPDS